MQPVIEIRNQVAFIEIQTKAFHGNDVNEYQIFQEFLEEHSEVFGIVLSFKKVELVNSTGIGTVLGIFKELQEEGKKMVLCHLKPKVRFVFDVMDVSVIIKMVPTEEDAQATFLKAG